MTYIAYFAIYSIQKHKNNDSNGACISGGFRGVSEVSGNWSAFPSGQTITAAMVTATCYSQSYEEV